MRYARGDRFVTGSPLDLVLLVALGGVGMIGVGVFALGASVLDIHAHRCDTCGNTWRHTGRASHGSAPAHTCAHCGALQWWRPNERERQLAHASRAFAFEVAS